MTDFILKPGEPLYVPSEDISIALSLGARMVEGDGRLRVPNPLPSGVELADFRKWVGTEARVVWLSELVQMLLGEGVDLLNSSPTTAPSPSHNGVKLYVTLDEADRARIIPGVRWSKLDGMYVADRNADFHLIHGYLTESARQRWVLENLSRKEIDGLVKSRALMSSYDGVDTQEKDLDM